MTPKKQVSPAIRILRGERDASARATHLEAATRKFLVTTNERKQMSTKTNFKRIALVAVAALGLGVLSSVPSSAAVSNLTMDVADGTATTYKSDTTTGGTVTIKGFFGAGTTDSVSVFVTLKSRPTGAAAITPLLTFVDTTTGSTQSAVKDATSGGATAATGWATTGTGVDSATSTTPLFISGTTNAYEGGDFIVHLDTAAVTANVRTVSALTAGTYVVTVIATPLVSNNLGVQTAGTAVTKDISIVVSKAANVSDTATTTYSFSTLSNLTVADGSSDAADSVIETSAVAGTTRGYLFVAVRNASNGSADADDSLTATVTGAGLVCSEAGTCGKSLSKVSITAGDYQFTLQGDGTGGTSTVTVTSGVTGLTYTHSLTYFASAKTITAAAYNPVLKVGTNPTAVAATAVDGNGVNWAGKAYIYASSAADALVAGSATTPALCSYDPDTKTQFCPVTAIAAGTAKFKVINASTIAAATVTSNEVTVTVSAALAATVKIAFNKATYTAGEKAYITVTVLDAAGKTLQGQNYSSLFATGGITSTYAFGNGSDTLTMTDITTDSANSATTPTTAGAKTYTVYMPTGSTGSVKITATGGTSLPVPGQVDVSATATVTDNAAQALAAVTALATTVASLKTLITTLTNLVLKIQKKVKA